MNTSKEVKKRIFFTNAKNKNVKESKNNGNLARKVWVFTSAILTAVYLLFLIFSLFVTYHYNDSSPEWMKVLSLTQAGVDSNNYVWMTLTTCGLTVLCLGISLFCIDVVAVVFISIYMFQKQTNKKSHTNSRKY